MQFSSQLIYPGTESMINVKPTISYTTKNAISTFSPNERGCYIDEEVELNFLTKRFHGLGYRWILVKSSYLRSTNPKYDKRLFIDFPLQYMKTTRSEHVVYTNCQTVLLFLFWHSEQFMCLHNMFWAFSSHVLNW